MGDRSWAYGRSLMGLRAYGRSLMVPLLIARLLLALSFEAIGALRPLLPQIRRQDRSLADQLVRAANSVALNIAEGDASDPGNQRARFSAAAGSANESLAALRVAIAWGYLDVEEAAGAARLLRRILAILWNGESTLSPARGLPKGIPIAFGGPTSMIVVRAPSEALRFGQRAARERGGLRWPSY
jgi:four helix bundle protein